MSKKPLNCACLLKILTSLVGVLGVSSLIPLPAFAQINPLLNPYTTLNSNIITPSATGVGPYIERTAIPGGTVTSSSGEVYNSDGTFVNPSATVITPDGTIIRSDGWISYPNEVIISPYGWVSHPNSTIISPNGWVSNLNGTVVSPSGEVITLGSNTTTPATTTTTPSR